MTMTKVEPFERCCFSQNLCLVSTMLVIWFYLMSLDLKGEEICVVVVETFCCCLITKDQGLVLIQATMSWFCSVMILKTTTTMTLKNDNSIRRRRHRHQTTVLLEMVVEEEAWFLI